MLPQLGVGCWVIGNRLHSIVALQDVNVEIQKQLYYVVFEHLVREPVEVMKSIFNWLGVSSIVIVPDNLEVDDHESDSYYMFKYTHKRYGKIIIPGEHFVPPRIQKQIEEQFQWFYETFYPHWGKLH